MRELGSASGVHEDSAGFDLRRKRSAEMARRVTCRAEWLDAKEREIAMSYFERGMDAVSIATMLNENPRLIRKRIKNIIRRLTDPRCSYVIKHRRAWAPKRREVAEELFLRGRSMREASERLGLTVYCVRKHRDAIDALTQAECEQPESPYAWNFLERGDA